MFYSAHVVVYIGFSNPQISLVFFSTFLLVSRLRAGELSSYFEKPFKLNNSKKTPLNTTKLNQPHLCYSLPIVCSVFPSCFQPSTHFHIEIPSSYDK